jgi:hypothetical protein
MLFTASNASPRALQLKKNAFIIAVPQGFVGLPSIYKSYTKKQKLSVKIVKILTMEQKNLRCIFVDRQISKFLNQLRK